MRPDADGRVGLLWTEPPPWAGVRVLVFAPHSSLAFNSSDWSDALVEVDCGEIELELRDGRRIRFVAGDLLWLAGLPVRLICNDGAATAVVVAVWRRVNGVEQFSEDRRDDFPRGSRLNVRDNDDRV